MAKIKKAKKYLLRSNAYHFDRRYLYNWRVERSLKVLTYVAFVITCSLIGSRATIF